MLYMKENVRLRKEKNWKKNINKPKNKEWLMEHYYALFSGGVDSAIAVLKIISQETNAKITPIFFDYGQKAAKKEREAVDNLIPQLRKFTNRQNNIVIEDCRKYYLGTNDLFKWSGSSILEGRKDFGISDLENRNMILISFIISIIKSDRKNKKIQSRQKIIVGFKNEHYDTTIEFASCMNKVIKQLDFAVEIVTPLIKDNNKISYHSLSKQIAEISGANSLISYTWSCYYPADNGRHCGKCSSCRSRIKLANEVKIRLKNKD